MRRSTSLALTAVLCFVLLLVPLEVMGEERPMVVLVAPSNDAPHIGPLRAELAGLGFDITIAIIASQPTTEQLEQLLGDTDAEVVLRVGPAAGGIEVWLLDGATFETVLRETFLPPEESADEEGFIALRAAELIRASLMEYHIARQQEQQAPEPPPEPPPPPVEEPEENHQLALGFAPAVATGPGGLGASPQMLIDVTYWPIPRLGVSASAFVPLFPFRLEGMEGEANVFDVLVGGSLQIVLGNTSHRWRPSLSAGFGALLLAMDGRAEDPYRGQKETVSTAMAWLGFDLTFDLHERVRTLFGVNVGMSLRKAMVRFDVRDVASFGHPLITAHIGIEFDVVQ